MMLYLDNAATTLKKPLSVYATLFKSTLFSGGNAGRGGHKMSMDACYCRYTRFDCTAF